MSDELLRKALREIEDYREGKVLRLTAGACTHDDYKFLCGEIHGLDLAKDSILAVLKKEEESDE